MRGRLRLAAALAVAGILTFGGTRGPAATRPVRWIISGPSVAAFAADGRARSYFSGAAPFVIRKATDTSPLPPEWHSVVVRTFTSFAELRRAFAERRIGSDVKAILYDNEAWTFTPDEEQRDLRGFTKQAAEIVHAHGLTFIAAPAVDLTRVLAPGPEKRYDAYLRLGLAADSARYADAVVIQAQGSERNVARYSSFVRAAALQARGARARVLVFAGLSTNPSGLRVSADDVSAAIAATRGDVDGYWMNVPQQSAYCPRCNDFRPDIATDVFSRLHP